MTVGQQAIGLKPVHNLLAIRRRPVILGVDPGDYPTVVA